MLFLVALEMIRGDAHAMHIDTAEGHWRSRFIHSRFPRSPAPVPSLQQSYSTEDDRTNVTGTLATIGVLALVLAIQFGVLLASDPISRLIGTTGASVIGRVMGMLLAALAISMLLGTVAEWLNLPAL